MAATATSTASAALLQAIGGGQFVRQDLFANALKGGLPYDTADGLTAQTSGSQANALQLGYGYSRLSVVANATDAVRLPAAVPGVEVLLVNDGANSTTVFGLAANPATGVGDTIDGVATATGNPMAAAKRAIFSCQTVGQWTSVAGAKIS